MATGLIVGVDFINSYEKFRLTSNKGHKKKVVLETISKDLATNIEGSFLNSRLGITERLVV